MNSRCPTCPVFENRQVRIDRHELTRCVPTAGNGDQHSHKQFDDEPSTRRRSERLALQTIKNSSADKCKAGDNTMPPPDTNADQMQLETAVAPLHSTLPRTSSTRSSSKIDPNTGSSSSMGALFPPSPQGQTRPTLWPSETQRGKDVSLSSSDWQLVTRRRHNGELRCKLCSTFIPKRVKYIGNHPKCINCLANVNSKFNQHKFAEKRKSRDHACSPRQTAAQRCQDQQFNLAQVITARARDQKNTYIAFLDIRKAYPWRLLRVAALRNARARLLCLASSTKHLSDTPRPFRRR